MVYLQNFLLRNPETDDLESCIQHWVFKYYQICSNYDTGLTLTIFMTWPNLFPNVSAWHIVMFFQACSPYPMHSGERYRTNGPLVQIYWYIIVNQNTLTKSFKRKSVTAHAQLIFEKLLASCIRCFI